MIRDLFEDTEYFISHDNIEYNICFPDRDSIKIQFLIDEPLISSDLVLKTISVSFQMVKGDTENWHNATELPSVVKDYISRVVKLLPFA